MVHRPLSLRARPDLRAEAMPSRCGEYWSVQDPLSLRCYRLLPEEYFVMQALNGNRSLAEIKRLFEKQFAPRQLVPQQLHAFLGMLHGEGLIVADAVGQGEVLLTRRRQMRRQRLRSSLTNPLAIRLPGVNPDNFLQWLLSKAGWLFSPAAIWLAGLLVIGAIALLLTEWKSVLAHASEMPAMLRTGDAVWFVVAIGVSKVLHELGHALTCKRFGGRCYELGMMLLVFVPCLYCNVSDASMLISKWQRMAVTAAGVIVELVLAAACLWVWWGTSPGHIHSFCLAMAVVCSLNTLLINGNPLLRFDGYYLLSDYMEIPNLAQAARQACGRCWDRLWAGSADSRHHRSLRHEPELFLVAYGVASFAYRFLILLVILTAIYRVLEPVGFVVLAHGLSLLLLVTMVLVPAQRVIKQRFTRAQQAGSGGIRRGLALTALCLGIVALLFVPVVRRVEVPVRIDGEAMDRVYVTVPGFLERRVEEAATVAPGQVLAHLDNPEFERELGRLRALHEEQALLVRNLRRLRTVVEDADAELASAEVVLAELQDRLRQYELRQRQLTLVAPCAGVILPPPEQFSTQGINELSGWEGTPLDRGNAGAYLAKGTWFCSIGDPDRVEAIALIEQGQIQRLAVGQQVRLWLDQLPKERLRGELVELAEVDLARDTPWWTSSDRGSAEDDSSEVNKIDAKERTERGTYYKARIAFDHAGRPPRIGSGGTAKVTVSAESLATVGYRFLRRTVTWLQ